MRVALAGCGDIARRYAASIGQAPVLELVGVTDRVPQRAEELAAELGVVSYPTLDELLADERVEAVVNLTPAVAHAEVTAACLEAGRHVHSEKPLALAYEDAVALVALASARGLRVSCAPATLMGEAQQTAWKLVREGAIGRVRVVYAEANWGRIETWHSSPESLYDVGPLGDVGVYPLAILTAMFGPARRVTAYRTVLEPERTTLAGEAFRLDQPDFVVAVIELADDVIVRMTASFYVEHHGKQRGIELHGDKGSIYMPTWGEANSRLELAVNGTGYEPVPYVKEPYPGIDWARPLVDLADAIGEGRPHRASVEQGAHLVELLEAVEASARDGMTVEVGSTFERPAPMRWASADCT